MHGVAFAHVAEGLYHSFGHPDFAVYTVAFSKSLADELDDQCGGTCSRTAPRPEGHHADVTAMSLPTLGQCPAYTKLVPVDPSIVKAFADARAASKAAEEAAGQKPKPNWCRRIRRRRRRKPGLAGEVPQRETGAGGHRNSTLTFADTGRPAHEVQWLSKARRPSDQGEEMMSQLANRPQSAPLAKPEGRTTTFKALLESKIDAIRAVASKGIRRDAAYRQMVGLAASRNPKIALCTPMSVLNTVINVTS